VSISPWNIILPLDEVIAHSGRHRVGYPLDIANGIKVLLSPFNLRTATMHGRLRLEQNKILLMLQWGFATFGYPRFHIEPQSMSVIERADKDFLILQCNTHKDLLRHCTDTSQRGQNEAEEFLKKISDYCQERFAKTTLEDSQK